MMRLAHTGQVVFREQAAHFGGEGGAAGGVAGALVLGGFFFEQHVGTVALFAVEVVNEWVVENRRCGRWPPRCGGP